jgi:hypothetical protein
MLLESSLSNHVNAAGLLLPSLACFHQKSVVKCTSSSSSSCCQRTPSTRCKKCPFNALLDAPSNALLDAPLQCDVIAPLQRVVTLSRPLQRVNQRTPSTHRSLRPFNATLLRPFNALFRRRAPSTCHYIVAPLQRVVRHAPSMRCLTCPFNALLNVPLQHVVQRAPLQHVVRCAPSTQHLRAHSTQLHRAPSTRCPTRPFNTSLSCASSSSMHHSTRPSTCRQHAPFNASSLRALPRVVVRVSATRLCLRHYAHCWCTLSRYVNMPFYCIAVE